VVALEVELLLLLLLLMVMVVVVVLGAAVGAWHHLVRAQLQ
jgi:hypothetical protein